MNRTEHHTPAPAPAARRKITVELDLDDLGACRGALRALIVHLRTQGAPAVDMLQFLHADAVLAAAWVSAELGEPIDAAAIVADEVPA